MNKEIIDEMMMRLLGDGNLTPPPFVTNYRIGGTFGTGSIVNKFAYDAHFEFEFMVCGFQNDNKIAKGRRAWNEYVKRKKNYNKFAMDRYLNRSKYE